MVWSANIKKGKLPILFIDGRVKIEDHHYYINKVLQDHLLQHAQNLNREDYFCSQQDSAPYHKATCIQVWLTKNVLDFLTSSDWLAWSPDLNPLNYFIWSYMLCKTGMTLSQFRNRLIKIWDEMARQLVHTTCMSCVKRCRAVVKERGERVELN
jgi:hypothetical protein